jgi:CRISPR-associated protein Cas1
MASLTPLHKNEQGNLTVKQVQHYENDSKRLEIASQMVLAIKSGILRNMRYYNDNNALEKEIKSVNSYVIRENSINHLLGIEGNIWSVYYSSFPKMFKDCENFKREFHPPKGPVNAMISFGNALLYSTCLSKIISANLNPSISFLHEPSDRSFSLSLDIADMFKPIIVERIIGNLLNNRMMADQDFRKVDEACYLSEHGRKKFLEQYDAKMKSTVKVGNKYYSYSSLIREECIKIEKHINTGERYNSIKSWD